MENQILEILKSMKQDMLDMKSQLNENTQILKALEHKADIVKAEQDNAIHDIAHIKGSVETIRKDITNIELITASNWADLAKLKDVK